MSKKTWMEQFDEKNIQIKRLESKVNCSQNTIDHLRNALRITMKENEILKDSLHQYKEKIGELGNWAEGRPSFGRHQETARQETRNPPF